MGKNGVALRGRGLRVDELMERMSNNLGIDLYTYPCGKTGFHLSDLGVENEEESAESL